MNERSVSPRRLLFECRAVAIALSIALLPWTTIGARGESPPHRVQAAAPVTAKLLRYAQYIVRQYDANKTGQLEHDEWRSMHGEPELADSNHDGLITVEEYAQYCANYGAGRAIRLSTLPGDIATHDESRDSSSPGEPRSSDAAAPGDSESAQNAGKQVRRRDTKYYASLPAGVPKSFVDRDADGDGQLTLSEYSPKLLKGEIDDFNRFDANHDGILTVQEFLRAGKNAKSTGPATPTAN